MRGRPRALTAIEQHELRRYREAGVSIQRLAGMWKISMATVYNILADQRAKFGPEQLPHDKRHLARAKYSTSKNLTHNPETT